MRAEDSQVASQFTGMAGGQLKEVHLVETSPTLRALQEKRLAPSAEKYGCTLEWHDSLDEIAPSEEEYTMLVAHEFFDALPFHTIEVLLPSLHKNTHRIDAYQKTEKGWQEILIALAESESESTDTPPYPRFRYVLSPQPTAASTLLGMSSPRFDSGPAPVGTRLEVSPAAFKTIRTVGELLAPRGRGCGLIVDYGAARAFDQSFRVSYALSSSRFTLRLTRRCAGIQKPRDRGRVPRAGRVRLDRECGLCVPRGGGGWPRSVLSTLVLSSVVETRRAPQSGRTGPSRRRPSSSAWACSCASTSWLRASPTRKRGASGRRGGGLRMRRGWGGSIGCWGSGGSLGRRSWCGRSWRI